ncbi:MAG TPA: carboxypeptidase-like regulatory domain-containing protein [Pyrinomonadaceae bacterium]|nr:carboxypeptidase-like regulatory domain-containing protein [Pyrinomonadaceae bacterium]
MPQPGETTRRGGNEVVTFIERKPFRPVHGVVRDANGQPVADVLVEVFDNPDWILQGHSESPVQQHRLTACKTGPDGRFCFEDLPAGRYELRASKDAAWNPSHVYVVVSPRGRKSTRAGLTLRLTVGT